MFHAPEIPKPAPSRISDGWSALILASCIHLSVFAILGSYESRRPVPEPVTETVRVVLKTEEPAPEPDPVPEPVRDEPKPQSEPMPLDVAKTTAAEPANESQPQTEPQEEPPATTTSTNSSNLALKFEAVGETIGDPDGAENPPEEADPSSIPPTPSEQQQADAIKKAERRRAEEEKLREIMARKGDRAAAFNDDVAEHGSAEVEGKLRAASASQQARKWLTNTEGVNEGIIRSLSTTDVPPAVAEQVLERYGIKIFFKMLDGNDAGYNYLNQAKTSGGTYFNRVGRGMYQVFSFGQAAVSRMMQLELDELQKRGHDPETTRVVEVEFGIIPTTRGTYDLGVKGIKAVPITVKPEEK